MANEIRFTSPNKRRSEEPSPSAVQPPVAQSVGPVDMVANRVLFKRPPSAFSASLRLPAFSAPLPLPDFSPLAPFGRHTTMTPPTPVKRKRSDAPTPSNWTARTPKPFASGSTMRVYDCSIEGLVVKLPELIRNPNRVGAHLKQIVDQQKLFQERGFPVAVVVNADTAVQDGCIVMEKFETVFVPADAPQDLRAQYKALLQKSWSEKLVVDLKPNNLFVKQGELVIADWDAAEDPADPDELPIVLRQAITMSAGSDETLKQYLTPEGSNLWEGTEV